MLERIFRLTENRTSVRTELLAGLTTFLTMAYIIFVNPSVLSTDFSGQPTGLDHGAVVLATCLAAALGSCIMGLVARYPIALAPGMGPNFFFVSVVMALSARGVPNAWQAALGVVFVAGVIFLVLSVLPVREWLLDSISESLRHGIAVGIGVFIAFIGLKAGKVVVDSPGTLVTLNTNFHSPTVVVFAAGFVVTAVLHALRIRGAIVLGILLATALALAMGEVSWPERVLGLPEVKRGAVFRMDIKAAFTLTCLPFVVVLVFMDLFDTLGTLVGVGERAGLIQNGKLARARRAFLSDAVGTVAGACLGTSTVTAYIESAAGVEQGGRTGLTSVTAGLLFLVALVFSPMIAMVGGYGAITGPALVLVGSLMLQSVTRIDWNDPTEGLPAFLIVIGIPLTYSIGDGLALGFITYPIIKLLAGRGREVKPLMYVLCVLMVGYFLYVR